MCTLYNNKLDQLANKIENYLSDDAEQPRLIDRAECGPIRDRGTKISI